MSALFGGFVDEKPPRYLGPGDTVTRADLTEHGLLIYRWTSNTRDGNVRVPLPCHERQAVTADPRRCAVVVCRICSATYDLELVDAGVADYTAHLTVNHNRPYLLSRAQPRKD